MTKKEHPILNTAVGTTGGILGAVGVVGLVWILITLAGPICFCLYCVLYLATN